MRDPRLIKLANLLVTYSTEVRPGDLVLIRGSSICSPLMTELYDQVLQAGGHPLLSVGLERCQELLLREGNDAQLSFVDPIAQHQIENVDVLIAMWGSENTKSLSTIAPERQARASQSRKKYMETYMKRAADGDLRWVGTQFPCQASAQDAEMSLAAYEEFVFGGGLLDDPDPASRWREISARQERLVEFLDGKEQLHFVAENGTDLKLNVAGRKWINCDGKVNFPDGEVFTGPIEDSVEGTVCYSFPAVHGGREVDGIRFVFREGKVVEATADKGEEFLHAMLDQDEGARRLGEIAIGTNYSITDYTKNTLFDEKIGGTFHAAVGQAYPETGATNESGLHWDMVCDLRKGGKIFVDGELLSENGRFVNNEFPR